MMEIGKERVLIPIDTEPRTRTREQAKAHNLKSKPIIQVYLQLHPKQQLYIGKTNRNNPTLIRIRHNPQFN